VRDLRLDFRLMVERLDQAFDDFNGADIHIGLDGDIHLRTGRLEVTGKAGKTI